MYIDFPRCIPIHLDIISTSKCYYSTTVPVHLVPSTNRRESGGNKGYKWSVPDVGCRSQGQNVQDPIKHSKPYPYTNFIGK